MRGCASIVFAMLVACAMTEEVGAVSATSVKPVPDPAAVRLLALNMYHEAGGEGRKGMLAVGWVVLNRMAGSSFPKTIEGVVGQGCQFGWRCDDRSDEPTHRAHWLQAQSIARELLTEPPPDPTRGAMWFHAHTSTRTGAAAWRPRAEGTTNYTRTGEPPSRAADEAQGRSRSLRGSTDPRRG